MDTEGDVAARVYAVDDEDNADRVYAVEVEEDVVDRAYEPHEPYDGGAVTSFSTKKRPSIWTVSKANFSTSVTTVLWAFSKINLDRFPAANDADSAVP